MKSRLIGRPRRQRTCQAHHPNSPSHHDADARTHRRARRSASRVRTAHRRWLLIPNASMFAESRALSPSRTLERLLSRSRFFHSVTVLRNTPQMRANSAWETIFARGHWRLLPGNSYRVLRRCHRRSTVAAPASSTALPSCATRRGWGRILPGK